MEASGGSPAVEASGGTPPWKGAQALRQKKAVRNGPLEVLLVAEHLEDVVEIVILILLLLF